MLLHIWRNYAISFQIEPRLWLIAMIEGIKMFTMLSKRNQKKEEAKLAGYSASLATLPHAGRVTYLNLFSFGELAWVNPFFMGQSWIGLKRARLTHFSIPSLNLPSDLSYNYIHFQTSKG